MNIEEAGNTKTLRIIIQGNHTESVCNLLHFRSLLTQIKAQLCQPKGLKEIK